MRALRLSSRSSVALLAAALSLALAACGDSPTAPSSHGVETVTVSPVNPSVEIGGQVTLSAALADAKGRPLTGRTVTWASESPAVATVANGVVTSVAVGTAVITATSEGKVGRVTVTITPSLVTAVRAFPSRATLAPGGQSRLFGEALDASGAVLAGRTVTYRSEDPAIATVDAQGRVTAVALGVTQIIVERDGASAPIPVTVQSAISGAFDIEVRFLGGEPDARLRAAVDSAVARWERVIVGDVPSQQVTMPAGQCNSAYPAVDEVIDDLVVFIRVINGAGPNGAAGAGGICVLRDEGHGLAALGMVDIYSDQLPALLSDGRATDVVTHEIGHVLGIGLLWNVTGVRQLAPSTTNGDPRYVGTEGRAAASVLGYADAGSRGVAVEASDAAGSAGGHWQEAALGYELMTPSLSGAGRTPLSLVTVYSLRDLGYVVDETGAEPFTARSSDKSLRETMGSAGAATAMRSGTATSQPQAAVRLDDHVVGPRFRADRRGRLTPIASPARP